MNSIFATLSLLAIPLLAAGTTVAAEKDDAGVKEAANEFYRALNTLFKGEAEPMKALWSHADDVNYMGPMGGLQVGWSQVSAIWEEQAALKLGGHVEASEMQITVGADLAVTSNYEKGVNTGADGITQTVLIRATNVFRKENGAWKMIGHHTDLLPYLVK